MKIKTVNLTLVLTFCLIFNSFQSHSQSSPDIPRLTNNGSLPNEFFTPASVNYENDIKRIDKRERKRKKIKTQKEFYLKSNFWVNDLLHGGKVVFEQEYSNYIRSIVEIILKNEPELAKKIKVYLIKSSAVNAFATQDGSIFVTIGLLTQVENEAQLAYILSHEIAHVSNKHSLAIALEAEKLKNETNKDRSLLKEKNTESITIKKHRFSQTQELEADRDGLKLYAETGYSLDVIDPVFDVLHYSYLPYDEIAFDKQYFNTPTLKIPESYFLDVLVPIKAENENANDSNSTHPNTFKRRSQAKELLKNYKSKSTEKYLVSENTFKTMQKVMRLELPMIQLHYEMYQDAIYNAFLIKKQYKTDKYADIITLKALYGIAKYRTKSDYYLNGKGVVVDSIEGESRQVYHFLDGLTGKQTTILALTHALKANKQYPQDSIILNSYVADLLWLLIDKHNAKLEEFKLFTQPTEESIKNTKITNIKITTDTISTADSLSKLDKIKMQQKQVKPTSNESCWEYALSDAISDSSFVAKFKDYIESKKYNDEHDTELKKKVQKHRDDQIKKGAYLGIPRVVLVNPYTFSSTSKLVYNKETYRDEYEMIPNFIKSERDQKRFLDLNILNAKIAGLDLVALSTTALKAHETEKFNDITLLNEWFYEQNSAGTMPILGVRQDEILRLANKYQTDYFLWSGYYYQHESKTVGKIVGKIVLGSFLYLISYGIFGNYILEQSDDSNLVYYSILYNVRTGKNEIIKYDNLEKKDRNTTLNAHIYDTYSQIKTNKINKK